MTNILLIESSLSGANSVSNGLAQELISVITADRLTDVTVRNLSNDPLPHVDGNFFQALGTPVEDQSDEQRAAATRSDALIGELETADEVIIAAPMYNFSVPSTLKAWIDHVSIAGRTFHYTEEGPKGLLTDKPVYIVATRGGQYSEGPMSALDFQVPYLKTVLGFVGLTNVTVITSEGLAMGDEAVSQSQALARADIASAVQQNRMAA